MLKGKTSNQRLPGSALYLVSLLASSHSCALRPWSSCPSHGVRGRGPWPPSLWSSRGRRTHSAWCPVESVELQGCVARLDELCNYPSPFLSQPLQSLPHPSFLPSYPLPFPLSVHPSFHHSTHKSLYPSIHPILGSSIYPSSQGWQTCTLQVKLQVWTAID